MKIYSSYPYILTAFLKISRSKLWAFGNDSSIDFQKEIDSDLGENLAFKLFLETWGAVRP